ncbi:MAG: pantetheine-phosphate adenylyltransferase [Candidatus Delongbacteria bacterium]|nr:pantetheine-phosphate adenylyltransferase [Candidatus Delongbacteria bacterium]
MSVKAIYPGTFDPITFGHIDIIKRAATLFGQVEILVAAYTSKDTLFSLEDRIALARQAVAEIDNVVVKELSGLLTEYARANQVQVVVRGLRMISDFDIEFQMALTNRKLYPCLETVFLTPNEKYIYLSASIVRELGKLHAQLDEFVPKFVAESLYRKFAR